jgi:hypothetical protein
LQSKGNSVHVRICGGCSHPDIRCKKQQDNQELPRLRPERQANSPTAIPSIKTPIAQTSFR